MIFRDFPLRFDPSLLLQLMQGWVESALAHLKHLTRYLVNALGDSPSVHGFEGNRFQDQQVECALHEVGRFTQWRGTSFLVP